jgi:hypothetical protein
MDDAVAGARVGSDAEPLAWPQERVAARNRNEIRGLRDIRPRFIESLPPFTQNGR